MFMSFTQSKLLLCPVNCVIYLKLFACIIFSDIYFWILFFVFIFYMIVLSFFVILTGQYIFWNFIVIFPPHYLTLCVHSDILYVSVCVQNDRYTVGGSDMFDTLTDLVEHYKRKGIEEITGNWVYLKQVSWIYLHKLCTVEKTMYCRKNKSEWVELFFSFIY